ncbi:MAG: DUF4380 domain-containing protein [Bacteroidia bacterium]
MNCTPEKKLVSPLVTLSNGIIEIGVIPAVGGVLVHASLVGQANILNSDSTLWNESPEKRPSLDPNAPFKTYNGHITWLSPQSEWWINQDSFPKLKKAHSKWPPDPVLTAGPYQIISQTATEIKLLSPESNFSKVQFTKTYRIEGNKVFLSTSAKNTGSETVSWGLWQNTRMNGWDFVFVQADSAALRKNDYYNQGNIRKPDLNYRNGFYTYDASAPKSAKVVHKAKAFFDVKNPMIAGHHQNQWLIIRSEAIDNTQIHPEETRVQLYIENSYQAATDLQELEMQFAYHAIAPGASIEASETWEILPGSGKSDKYELLEELRRKL